MTILSMSHEQSGFYVMLGKLFKILLQNKRVNHLWYWYVSLALKAQVKNHLKLSAKVVCCKLFPNITSLSIEANSVDPDQTAPIGAV